MNVNSKNKRWYYATFFNAHVSSFNISESSLNVSHLKNPQLIIKLPFKSIKSTLRTLAVCLPIVLLLNACGEKVQQQQSDFPPPAVSVAEVIVRDITPWEEFTGRIKAQEIVQIRPRVGGIIEQKHYREGDIVKQGDLLFTIDQKPIIAELNRAKAELARNRAQAEFARLESLRATNLLKTKLISQDEYDQKMASEQQTKANVRATEANVRLARLNLEYTKVRAPIAGRTGLALATKGNLVSSSPTPDLLTTIVSLDPVYVIFDSDELTYLQYFGGERQSVDYNGKEKRTVYVGLGNEQGFPREGYVDFIDNQVNSDTGTIRLRAVLENKDFLLTPGLFARIKLLGTTPMQTILIADEAILTDQDRKYVYVLSEDKRAVRRDITIDRNIKGLRIVSNGLKPKEQIIVHGIQKVFFPGMPVIPQLIGMGDPPPTPGAQPTAEH